MHFTANCHMFLGDLTSGRNGLYFFKSSLSLSYCFLRVCPNSVTSPSSATIVLNCFSSTLSRNSLRAAEISTLGRAWSLVLWCIALASILTDIELTGAY